MTTAANGSVPQLTLCLMGILTCRRRKVIPTRSNMKSGFNKGLKGHISLNEPLLSCHFWGGAALEGALWISRIYPILCFVRLSPFQSGLVKPALIVDASVFVLRIRK